MNNNIKKLLISAFVSAVGVVSLYGRETYASNKITYTIETETEKTNLNTHLVDKNNINFKSFKFKTINTNTNIETQELSIIDLPEVEFIDGWTTTNVNVRLNPEINSEILDTYAFNTHVSFRDFNEEWVEIIYKYDVAYIAKKYITTEEHLYKTYNVKKYSGFKSWMPYNLFGKSTNQYKLQQLAVTGEYGIRYVDEYACIAVGTFANTKIGQRIDLVLENGTIIKCVMADEKSDKHTDSNNMFTINSDCCSEFIIDKSALDINAKRRGDMSYCNEKWNSPVVQFYVYDENVLN